MVRRSPREISASGNRDIIFQPEYLKCALDNLLEKEHVDYFLHTVLIGAETVENEIRTIQCADDEGLFTVSAKAFVDATGDANLSRLAGAKLIWGNDGGHPQAATLTFRLSGVAADVDLSPAAVERAVVRAKAEGIRNLTREKRIYPQNGKLRDRPCPSSEHHPEGLRQKRMTRMERETRKQVLGYIRHCEPICREWSTVSWR